MDAVNAFNQELFSLMDMKPPISRAKMILITKAAIKAIKLYKHVVQIVEKFIKKCKPEYKVPGLYVIDSIVRQSRHQFGTDKDVFGPRFSKNITATFQYLYLCPSEDKSKIVRVLNLWQKNGVFKIEIIQPLLDMAAGTSNAAPVAENVTNNEGSPPPPVKVSSEPPTQATPNSVPAVPQLPSSDAFAAVAQLFQTTQGQQLQQILQTFQQPPKPQSPALDNAVMAQVQAITAQLKTTPTQPSEQKAAFPPPEQKTAFDKKLLDRFDYDDEPEAVEESKKEDTTAVTTTAPAAAVPPAPTATVPAAAAPAAASPPPPQAPFGFPGDGMQQPAYTQHQNMDQFQPRMMGIQQDPMHHQVPLPPNGQMPGFGLLPTPPFPPMAQPVIPPTPPVQQPFQASFQAQNEPLTQKPHQQEMEVEQPCIQEVKRHMSDNRKSRSRSASRSPKRRRSRSGSRSRRSRHRRSRSRSRDRRRHSPRSRSQERRDREKERERRQKGLPQVKPETASVCSTTLWVGQLDKRTTQQDVASLLEEFGPIESINMIPPRGCAYIVMVHRQDAYRALQKLSRGNYKVNQKSIKIAWALNKGIKADYKQYWDVELGVTYIPWDKVKPEELESFCEGGMLDSDTLNPDWKGIPKKPENEVAQNGGAETSHTEPVSPIPKPLPVPVPPIPVPAPITVPPPQVPPHQPGPPVVGALQPPAFTPPLGIPPPGFGPGVPPPPPPPPFLRPGFNPMHLPPGFLPPGPPPPITPPVSIPPPHTPPISIPNLVSGARGNAESGDSVKMYGSAVPPAAPTNLPTPPVTQPVSLLGTQGVAPGPVIGLQAPSTGLLGARPGLIPLQRPPGMPPPHLQRFPLMPPRPMPPHMMHRGPPPGPGGFAMPPPHGMKGPFPPHGPFVRPGGMPGLGGPGPGPGGPEDRDGRQQPPQQPQQQPQPQAPQQPQQQQQQQPPPSQQPPPTQQQPQQFRNDNRQQFNSGRDQERFGRRSFGNRVENDRERYGNRNDDRDNSNRDRREWGRRSPDRDRHRDLEERNRRSSGHRDRERDSRDRESRREKEEARGKEKPEVTDRAGGNKTVEPPISQVGNVDTASELEKGVSEAAVLKPSEELPAEATSSVEPEKDSGSAAEAPR
ncbi:SCAF4 isoform 1 [Pan troglodytes]|uniref:SR-related CTD-associated factor 4 n=3 Tax=Homininae TaxID=207598 RepID=K7AGS2_PANTR|nr:SR-related and CTD-associated factor 4 isoform 3 [Homo sapiens]XP_003319089.1 SR-related and CTD-associated factor 4 isoform X3 [Pan troglodytes]XP_003813273.1 SR-related and CTD-associated factor 4 isoform X5 [Pan paniscus]EAX09885.1 splicing factor, arginine/serine-rich 15, isoform CRA_b [Homo sapiens]KAI2595911.1 SR-related CTD associated factor 4 [Homo sapiens]KAI4003775.1 SR-related CTD associated factor 4 [Homo sapiens]PNI61573.1 SCAF4 isoform 1 [Pan troglodytes]CAD38974.2 hypotheti|eukprot:NP_001138917.1 splicing factor, arginine/serine-rich 15 isoform 3 [Homo sapiens]